MVWQCDQIFIFSPLNFWSDNLTSLKTWFLHDLTWNTSLKISPITTIKMRPTNTSRFLDFDGLTVMAVSMCIAIPYWIFLCEELISGSRWNFEGNSENILKINVLLVRELHSLYSVCCSACRSSFGMFWVVVKYLDVSKCSSVYSTPDCRTQGVRGTRQNDPTTHWLNAHHIHPWLRKLYPQNTTHISSVFLISRK